MIVGTVVWINNNIERAIGRAYSNMNWEYKYPGHTYTDKLGIADIAYLKSLTSRGKAILYESVEELCL